MICFEKSEKSVYRILSKDHFVCLIPCVTKLFCSENLYTTVKSNNKNLLLFNIFLSISSILRLRNTFFYIQLFSLNCASLNKTRSNLLLKALIYLYKYSFCFSLNLIAYQEEYIFCSSSQSSAWNQFAMIYRAQQVLLSGMPFSVIVLTCSRSHN